MVEATGRARDRDPADIIVAPMCADNASQVSSLFADIVSELPYYNIQAKDAEISKYASVRLLAQIEEDPHSVLVATFGGDIAGFAFSQFDDGLIWLAWFGVHQHYRRNGIATAILDAIISRARNSRAHKIWCDCRTTNLASRYVLDRAFFQPVSTFNRHWYDQDYIIWEKLVS